jgi:hypothetical protein
MGFMHGATEVSSSSSSSSSSSVVQLVEALCYKSEGCGFDSQWVHWDFY